MQLFKTNNHISAMYIQDDTLIISNSGTDPQLEYIGDFEKFKNKPFRKVVIVFLITVIFIVMFLFSQKIYDFQQNKKYPEHKINQFLIFVPVIYLMVIVYIFGVNQVFWDHWVFAKMLERFREGNMTFKVLLAPHDFHLIPMGHLIQLGLAIPTRFNNFAFLYGTLITILVTYLICYKQAGKDFGFNFKTIPMWFLPIVFFMVNIRHEELLLEGWVAFTAPMMLSVLAFFMIQKSYEFAERKKIPVSVILFSLSFLSAFIATFTSNPGLMVWLPVLFQILIQKNHKTKWMKVGIWLGLAVIVFYLYFKLSPLNGNSFDFNFLEMLWMFLGLLGGFLGFSSPLNSIIVGSLLLGIFVLLSFLLIKNRKISQYSFWLTLGVYTLFITMGIAVSRGNMFSLEQIIRIQRYVTYTMNFFLVIYMLAHVFEAPKKSLFYRYIRVVIIILALYFNVHRISDAKWNKTRFEVNQQIMLNYQTATDEELKRLYSDSEFVTERLDYLREHNLNIFAYTNINDLSETE